MKKRLRASAAHDEAFLTVSVVHDQPGHPVAPTCAADHCRYEELQQLLRSMSRVAARTISAELSLIAVWLRTPGHLLTDDPITEIARRLEETARAYDRSVAVETEPS